MSRMIIILIASLFASTAFPATVESVRYSVTEKNGVYNSHTLAKIKGNYERFVDTITDFQNYPKMKISFFKENKILYKNGKDMVVWNKLHSIFMSGEYYTRITIVRNHQATTVIWYLVPKVDILLSINEEDS